MNPLSPAAVAHVYDAVICFFCVFAATVLAKLCVVLFNALPAKWFCDYDEQPGEDLYRKRLFFRPHGIMMAVILSLSFIGMYYQYRGSVFFLIACCGAAVILVMIGAADTKYFIIPDQFTLILLLIFAVIAGYDLLSGTHLFNSAWLSPLYGAAAGFGLILLFAVAGRLVYKKEAMGFGDVKLFAAAGLLTGFPHIFAVFFMTIFLALFYIIYLMLHKRITRDLYLALGPYLCLSLLLFLAFHSQIDSFAAWYMSLLNV
nr:A24 family peptidase [uncultured Caproiciproducens sp.]